MSRCCAGRDVTRLCRGCFCGQPAHLSARVPASRRACQSESLPAGEHVYRRACQPESILAERACPRACLSACLSACLPPHIWCGCPAKRQHGFGRLIRGAWQALRNAVKPECSCRAAGRWPHPQRDGCYQDSFMVLSRASRVCESSFSPETAALAARMPCAVLMPISLISLTDRLISSLVADCCSLAVAMART